MPCHARQFEFIRPLSRRRWLVVCALAAGAALCCPSRVVEAQEVINREYPLKALFIYNFGTYVEWTPHALPTPEQPFVIGILGASPIQGALRDVAVGRTIAGRQIAIEHYPTVDAIRSCHILFVGRDVALPVQNQVVQKLWNQPVLIVGETPGFAQRGGVVNFAIEDNKVKFEINVDAARQHHLKISAKLLSLAKIVTSTGAQNR